MSICLTLRSMHHSLLQSIPFVQANVLVDPHWLDPEENAVRRKEQVKIEAQLD